MQTTTAQAKTSPTATTSDFRAVGGAAGGGPSFYKSRPEAVPDALRRVPQWLAYRAVPVPKPDGTRKLNKIPTDPKTGRNGKSNDPSTWGTFDQAVAYIKRTDGMVGIGFAFTHKAGITALDLDHCLDADGNVHPQAQSLMDRFPGAWVEMSPGGNGIHLWMRGTLDGVTSAKYTPEQARMPFGVEIFCDRFFMTVTGRTPDDAPPPVELPDYTDALKSFHRELKRGEKRDTPPPAPVPVQGADRFESEVIARLPGAGPREVWGDGWRWIVTCPNHAAHTTGDDKAAVLFTEARGPGFKCQHTHCTGFAWPQFAARHGVKWDSPHADPIEAARAGCPFALTDLGNAERFAAYYGSDARWDVARKIWRVFDGRRWAADSALRVQALAADTARKIRQEAAAAPAGDGKRDIGRDLFAHAVKSESRDRLAAMLEVAKARPGMATAAEQFDADPWLLNCGNGTLDLRTGELRGHNRDDLLTKVTPVEYVPGARCERWERLLCDATGGDPGLIDFLQALAGYTLTGLTVEEVLVLIYGPEAASKTTFLESLRAVLGEYARTIQADVLAKQREHKGGGGASPELAALAGARLAAGSEMEQGRELAEALAKNLTGGDHITARHLYAEFFDYRPQFKIWLALNHCPRVSADDGAIWRRIIRVGFDHTIPPDRRDKSLKPYLRDPAGGAPAVLAWAVAGCLRWQVEGLRIPDAVRKSTEAYRAESDPLAPFIEDCLRPAPAAWTPWGEIWAAYCEHATEAGTLERYRVAPKRLQERLKHLGYTPERRRAGRGWLGVELETEWKNPENPPEDTPRDGCDGCDTIPETFSTKENAGKLLESAVTPVTPVTGPRVPVRVSRNHVSFRRVPAGAVAAEWAAP